jgi:hypothetical protein
VHNQKSVEVAAHGRKVGLHAEQHSTPGPLGFRFARKGARALVPRKALCMERRYPASCPSFETAHIADRVDNTRVSATEREGSCT